MHILRCVQTLFQWISVQGMCTFFFLLLSISSRFLQTPSPCSMLQTRMTTMYKIQFYKNMQKKSQLCRLSRGCDDTSC
uniref:Putative secreted protein n=1 Tax=Ixodes ricinus TaxID=34613 RepID=A0A6B0U4Y7_IXORI